MQNQMMALNLVISKHVNVIGVLGFSYLRDFIATPFMDSVMAEFGCRVSMFHLYNGSLYMKACSRCAANACKAESFRPKQGAPEKKVAHRNPCPAKPFIFPIPFIVHSLRWSDSLLSFDSET
jgi:hypothetical protein